MPDNMLVEKLTVKQLARSPEPQWFWTFVDGEWSPAFDNKAEHSSSTESVSHIHLITWNIDMSAPMNEARMSSALDYLSELVDACPASSAPVIFLQELLDTDLSQIAKTRWIQEKFLITDLPQYLHVQWMSLHGMEYVVGEYVPQRRSRYGTITLLDRRFDIQSVSRLEFISEFGRDALFVDLRLASTDQIVRLCNVHLDSMAGSPPLRPVQWKAAAHWLQQENVAASILAGDCNAHQEYDRTAPQALGFKDAYLENGGQEDAEGGFTWGYQCHYGTRFSPSRMDKVVFWGDIEVKDFHQVGVGVRVKDSSAAGLGTGEELPFVTDHYGLMAEFHLCENGLRLLK